VDGDPKDDVTLIVDEIDAALCTDHIRVTQVEESKVKGEKEVTFEW
jgi:hypothetical protein